MKKLILALSFSCLHAPIFCAQEASPLSSLQQELEQNLRHPVHRAEAETHVVFTAPLKEEFLLNVYASLEKSTGFVKIESYKRHYYQKRWELTHTDYEENPQETYNALQALYEKKQADAGEHEQQESKEEEQENQ